MFKLPLPKSEAPKEASNDGTAEADEDKRFLGSGMSAQQQEIWDWVDTGEMAPSSIDLSTLKKLAVKLSKAVTTNEERRLKYADSPESFAESEGSLAEEIAGLTRVSLVPSLYPQAISLGILDKLLGLLAHENSDIVGAVLGVLDEWTGEDVLLSSGTADEEGEQDTVKPPDAQSIRGMEALLEALLEQQGILETLVQTLSRLNPESEDDQQGLYHGLSLIENLIALDPNVTEEVARKSNLLPWLLSRISQAFKSSTTLSPVSVYSAEILAILLQDCQPNRERFASGVGVEVLLKALSFYRKRDPKDDDETEFMENLFDALCSALSESSVKTLFLEEEGLELMLLLMKQKKMARIRAVKVVNHALLSPSGYALAHKWIEILGLKTLFAAFMRKGIKDFKKTYKGFSEKEEEGVYIFLKLYSAHVSHSTKTEHIISIIVSLFKHADTIESQFRLLAKFLELDKVDRLVELHFEYVSKLERAGLGVTALNNKKKRKRSDSDSEDSEEEEDEEQQYLDRLEKGLFTLQLVDLVILNCIALEAPETVNPFPFVHM